MHVGLGCTLLWYSTELPSATLAWFGSIATDDPITMLQEMRVLLWHLLCKTEPAQQERTTDYKVQPFLPRRKVDNSLLS